MKGVQLSASYFIESIKKLLDETYPNNSPKLLENLSYFELESTDTIPDWGSNYPGILAVANNIISRGLPTRMSYSLEKIFSKIFNYLEEFEELGGNYYKLKNSDSVKQFWEALHIIEPRLNKENIRIDYEQSFEKLGSDYEKDFLLRQIPNLLGDYSIQILESQRYLNELLKVSELTNNLQQNFKDQRVDFSIEYLYGTNQNGTIIEIDGFQHNQASQHNLDDQRDQAAIQCNWQPIRIKTSEWNLLRQKLQPLIQLLNEDYFQILKLNYYKNLSGEWLDILQFVLSPIAISRVQKTIIELIMRGVLDLKAEKWNICIIERDVPCGHLATNDIEKFLKYLFSLETKGKKLPNITLIIYSTTEFVNSKIHQYSQSIINSIDTINTDTNSYDVVLDVSVLQRSRLSPKLKFPIQPKYYFKIRSSHSLRSKRNIISSDLIEYPSFIEPDTSGNYFVKENYKHIPAVLEYFLKNIFRKNYFKIGQLPILSRALSQKNVVGLLPTGGGKSLTYQLAALLQPGITTIIDPIKSLMKDQVDGLKRNLIDNCLYINSSMNWEQRKEAHKKIANGEVLFIFVSPERLQMEEFRYVLKSLPENNFYFSFCVIDEAHCVSEWGHDFRTPYLRLGENVSKYCQTKSGNPVTIFGLTATASFDVLADILREISNSGNILESDAIVRFETTNRPEIQYEVVQINIDPVDNNLWNIKEQLGKAKQDKINELLSTIPSKLSYYNNSNNPEDIFNDAYKADPEREKHLGKFEKKIELGKIQIDNFPDNPNLFFNSGCSNSGIVFCPHRGWYFGVTDKYKSPPGSSGVYDNIRTDFNIKKGSFIGVDNENIIGKRIEEDNINNQDNFINNKLNLLISTKAFGMGIDKPNIRFSVHLNYPQSIESFVQESGRTGRDGKLSLAYILFNDQQFVTNEGSKEFDKEILEDFHSNSFRGETKEKVIIWELLSTISYPTKTNVDLINDFLEEEGYDANANFWYQNGINRLYLNHNYGYINLNNFTHVYNNDSNVLEAQEVFRVVLGYINQNMPQNIDIISWLNYLNSQPRQEGIQQILQNNPDFELTIGFSNDWENIFSMISIFLNNLNININAVAVKQACGIGKKRKIKFEDFYYDLHINLNLQNKVRLETLFYRFRDKQDTDKAVYRLSTLGIIDEYEVDYRTHTYKISGKKKTDNEIKESLKSYLRKYYSEQRVNAELNKIPSIIVNDDNNYLHKCVSFLISFIYNEIAKKRKQAIDDMKYACFYRIQSSNKSFKDYIYYYFNSKYARKGYTENGINQSLYDRFYNENDAPIDHADSEDVIWEFISFVGSDINNFRHLRGACIRLMQLQPDYFSIHLLKSYAVFTIEQNNPVLLEDGKNDFIKGCELYFEKIKYDNVKFFSVIDKFIRKVNDQTNNQLNIKLEQAISYVKLKTHNNWLEKTINILEK